MLAKTATHTQCSAIRSHSCTLTCRTHIEASVSEKYFLDKTTTTLDSITSTIAGRSDDSIDRPALLLMVGTARSTMAKSNQIVCRSHTHELLLSRQDRPVPHSMQCNHHKTHERASTSRPSQRPSHERRSGLLDSSPCSSTRGPLGSCGRALRHHSGSLERWQALDRHKTQIGCISMESPHSPSDDASRQCIVRFAQRHGGTEARTIASRGHTGRQRW